MLSAAFLIGKSEKKVFLCQIKLFPFPVYRYDDKSAGENDDKKKESAAAIVRKLLKYVVHIGTKLFLKVAFQIIYPHSYGFT